MKKLHRYFTTCLTFHKFFIQVLTCGICLFILFFKTGAQNLSGDTAIHVRLKIPRFLYEGDRVEVVAAVANLTATEQTGQLQLQLSDAATNTSVDGWFQNMFPVQYFTVASQKTEPVRFPIEAPFLFRKTVRWRVLIRDSVVESGVVSVLAAEEAPDSKGVKTRPPFQLRKQVFLKREGQPLRSVAADTTTIHIHDSLKIRLTVTATRDVAQVQLTDTLAAAFALVANSATAQVSQTPDSTAIQFFLPLLHKGRSVLEYLVTVTNAGVFRIAPATLQTVNRPEQMARTKAAQMRIEE